MTLQIDRSCKYDFVDIKNHEKQRSYEKFMTLLKKQISNITNFSENEL